MTADRDGVHELLFFVKSCVDANPQGHYKWPSSWAVLIVVGQVLLTLMLEMLRWQVSHCPSRRKMEEFYFPHLSLLHTSMNLIFFIPREEKKTLADIWKFESIVNVRVSLSLCSTTTSMLVLVLSCYLICLFK